MVLEQIIDNSDLLLQGTEYFKNENYEQAILYFIQIMQSQQTYKYFCQRGINLDIKGMYFGDLEGNLQGINNFTKHHDITVRNLALYLRGINQFKQFGMSNYYMNNTSEAIQDFTQVLKTSPSFKFCYNDRGNAYSSLLQYVEAVQDYSEAIKLDNQYAIAYTNRGTTLSDMGKKEEGLLDYLKSIEIDPLDAETYQNISILYQDLGRNEEALVYVSKAIEINEQFSQAYYNRGNIFSQMRWKEEAILDYTTAIEINPYYADAYTNRGNVFKELGRPHEALLDYQKVGEINENDAKGFFNKGLYIHNTLFQANTLDDLGRKEEALNDYAKAIELNPMYDKAYFNRGTALFYLGRKKEALLDYSKAIELNPKDADGYYNKAILFMDLGREQDALNDYMNALLINPNDPLLNVQLGIMYLNNDEIEKAFEYIQKGQDVLATLTESDKIAYNLSENNLSYIKQRLTIRNFFIQRFIKIKNSRLAISIQATDPTHMEVWKQQINLAVNKDSCNSNNQHLQAALIDIKKLKQKMADLENQRIYKIQIQLIQLKKDENRYTYYQSLFWRLYNYFSACQQLSTELFKKNTEVMIQTSDEKVGQITTKVVQQISDITGSITIAGSVFKIISQALERSFQGYLDFKFNQIVIKLTQITQVRCNSKNDFDEEIQLATIKCSQQVPEIIQEQKEDLIDYVKQICQSDKECGNDRAGDPYWKQGVKDTLKILKNLIQNYESIQENKEKSLHLVILEQLQQKDDQVKQESSGQQSFYSRESNNCCKIL